MARVLRSHPVLSILPPLTQTELEVAVERVNIYGQRTPIETVNGEIVAGYDEYQACIAAGVNPKTTAIKAPSCLVEYVIRRLPRNLTNLDRACIAVLAEEEWKKLGRERMREAGRLGGRLKGKGPRTMRDPFGHDDWFKVAARIVGTTPSAVKRLATLRRAAPDIFQAVRGRKLVVLKDARDIAQALDSRKSRAKVLKLVEKNPRLPVGRLVAEVMRTERPTLRGTPAERGRAWVVYEGPLVREGRRIPDSSVDLVHCDILYKDVSMAEDVAKLAKRVLVADGLLAMIAGTNVLDIMNAIAKHLAPIAIGAYYLKGNSPRKWVGPVRKMDALPVLIFGRGRLRQIDHLAYVSELKEPDWCGWQKNLAATRDLIASMTPPGSRVLDPCCGSGTTGEAALRHRCEFVGIDVDSQAVKTTRARLAAVEKELGNGVTLKRVG